MQISNQIPLTLATNLKQNQISQHPNAFKDELEKANLTEQNSNTDETQTLSKAEQSPATNMQIQSEETTNAKKSEFEKVVSELLWGLEQEGKIEELKNVFAFITSAVFLFKYKTQKSEVEVSDLPMMISILKEPYTLQAGTYMGQVETNEHFNARKNQAINYLSELLAQI